MSDFGTLITAVKKSGTVSKNELNQLSDKLKSLIQSNEDYINYLGEPYEHDFDGVENSANEAIALLSEYYFGEDDDENDDLYQTIEDEELEDAKSLAEKLAGHFPEFSFEAEVTTW